MLVNILPCTGQPSEQRLNYSKISIMLSEKTWFNKYTQDIFIEGLLSARMYQWPKHSCLHTAYVLSVVGHNEIENHLCSSYCVPDTNSFKPQNSPREERVIISILKRSEVKRSRATCPSSHRQYIAEKETELKLFGSTLCSCLNISFKHKLTY